MKILFKCKYRGIYYNCGYDSKAILKASRWLNILQTMQVKCLGKIGIGCIATEHGRESTFSSLPRSGQSDKAQEAYKKEHTLRDAPGDTITQTITRKVPGRRSFQDLYWNKLSFCLKS